MTRLEITLATLLGLLIVGILIACGGLSSIEPPQAMAQAEEAPQPVLIPADAPTSKVRILPDGTVETEGAVSVDIQEEGQRSETRPSVARTDGASAKGAGVNVTGQEAKLNQDAGTAPIVSLGGVADNGVGDKGSKGNAGTSSTSAEGRGINQGALFLYGLGGICIIAGAVAGTWGKQPLMGIGLGFGGVVCIASGLMADEYPALLFACVGGLTLAGVIYTIVIGKWGAEDKTALTAVVGAVKDLEPIAELTTDTIKERVEKRAGKQAGVVKVAVGRAKDRVAKAKAKAEAAGVV